MDSAASGEQLEQTVVEPRGISLIQDSAEYLVEHLQVAHEHYETIDSSIKLIANKIKDEAFKAKLHKAMEGMAKALNHIAKETKTIGTLAKNNANVLDVANLLKASAKRIKSINKSISKTAQTVQSASPKTFAQVTAESIKANVKLPSGKSIRPQATSVVTIMPSKDNDKLKTADDTKDLLKKTVDPEALGLKLDRVTRFGKAGVRLQSSCSDLRCLPREALAGVGLEVRDLGKRSPRLVVHDTPADLSEVRLVRAVISQNFEETQHADIEGKIKALYKVGPKGQKTESWVLEVQPEVRHMLLNKGRIYIEWNSCRVRDHIRVSRCFKCQKLGHIAKDCRSAEQCSHCAGSHLRKDCDKVEEEPCCANCKRFGFKGDAIKHDASSAKCPTYLRRLEDAIRNTDYGA